MKALQEDWRLYSFIDLDLWDDRRLLAALLEAFFVGEIVMLFVPYHPLLYSKLSMEIKKDRELAKLVLSNSNGWMLDSMPAELQRDKEVVLVAARNAARRWASWSLLRCVDRALLADKEVVMACGGLRPFKGFIKAFTSKGL